MKGVKESNIGPYICLGFPNWLSQVRRNQYFPAILWISQHYNKEAEDNICFICLLNLNNFSGPNYPELYKNILYYINTVGFNKSILNMANGSMIIRVPSHGEADLCSKIVSCSKPLVFLTRFEFSRNIHGVAPQFNFDVG